MSLAFYGITVFGMSMKGSLISISVYWGILVYIVFSLPFIIMSGIYRERYQKEYKELFVDVGQNNIKIFDPVMHKEFWVSRYQISFNKQ
jgi:uncharacterized membrane protein (DUF485 family)